jgi:RNA-binding protein Musashi
MADDSYYGRNSANISSPQTTSSTAAPTPNSGTRTGNADVESRLFLGGLSWQTTEESLRFHFEQYGQVAAVEIMRDRNTGQPRGFGFVVFADKASVDSVMETPVHEINHKVRL